MMALRRNGKGRGPAQPGFGHPKQLHHGPEIPEGPGVPEGASEPPGAPLPLLDVATDEARGSRRRDVRAERFPGLGNGSLIKPRPRVGGSRNGDSPQRKHGQDTGTKAIGRSEGTLKEFVASFGVEALGIIGA